MKIIGILGGMGPESTADLFSHIIDLTPATKDAEHIPIYINNTPSVPDRSAFILGKGPDPAPALIENAQKLERWGADFLIMPCNTAHYFIDKIRKEIHIPVLDMIGETAACSVSTGKKRFGLLSTLGTYKTRLYETAFRRSGLEIIVPGAEYREQTMEAIYGKRGLKAGCREEPSVLLKNSLMHLYEKDIQAVISGCTELAMVLDELVSDRPVLNPTRILAQAAVRFAGGR